MAVGDKEPVAASGASSTSDPTALTTDALHREIETLDKLIESRLDGLSDTLDEKFRGVDRQFELVERQRVEQKKDTKDAVDAALAAQKEAGREQTAAQREQFAKSESTTTKMLDQLNANFVTGLQGVSRNIDDLKERVGKIENVRLGGQQMYMTLIVVAGLLLAVLGYLATNNP